MGSMEAARRAGIKQAARATTTKQNRNRCKRQPIGGVDAIKHAAQKARRKKRNGNADSEPCDGKAQSLPQHLAKHIALSSAERHADSDFMGALPGGVGHHTINSHGGQKQGQQSECTREDRGNALKDISHLHVLLESGHVVQRQVGIEAVNRLLNRGGMARGSPLVRTWRMTRLS